MPENDRNVSYDGPSGNCKDALVRRINADMKIILVVLYRTSFANRLVPEFSALTASQCGI